MSIDFELYRKYKYVCSKIDLTEEMAQCGALVQVAMKYRDPQNASKFLFTLMIVGRYVNNKDCGFNQPASCKMLANKTTNSAGN